MFSISFCNKAPLSIRLWCQFNFLSLTGYLVCLLWCLNSFFLFLFFKVQWFQNISFWVDFPTYVPHSFTVLSPSLFFLDYYYFEDLFSSLAFIYSSGDSCCTNTESSLPVFSIVVSLWVFIISFLIFFSSFLCAITCEAFYVVFICSHILFSESSFLKWFFSFSSLQSYYPPLSFPINIHAVLWHIMWFL